MAGTVNGPPPTRDIQPTCKPIAWLVLPFGTMLSTSVFMLSHSSIRPFTAFGQGTTEFGCGSAGYSDDHLGVTGSGGSEVASKLYVVSGSSGLPRSMTQPFQFVVLWVRGFQVP